MFATVRSSGKLNFRFPEEEKISKLENICFKRVKPTVVEPGSPWQELGKISGIIKIFKSSLE